MVYRKIIAWLAAPPFLFFYMHQSAYVRVGCTRPPRESILFPEKTRMDPTVYPRKPGGKVGHIVRHEGALH